jgi:hypothetical protein
VGSTKRRGAAIGAVLWLSASAAAQTTASPAAAPASSAPAAEANVAPAVAPPALDAAPPALDAAPPAPERDVSFFARAKFLSRIQVHGFVSEGGFKSTANDYIGASERGSLKFFDLGINISTELTDQLRVGLQLVSRSVGTLSEEVPRIDWALADYRFRPWLGLRAGVIKMPLGLYNEYVAIDAGRTAILLPQSLYPLRNRDALISHTGFAVYGSPSLGKAGALDYQAWLGTLTVPRSALELSGASLDAVDTRYVTGAQLFWRTPLEGLRLGGSYLRASIDFDVTVDPSTVEQLVMAGVVPPDYRGALLVSQRPTSFWVASLEYIRGDWLLAAEYSRSQTHQQTSLPQLIPTIDQETEGFYGLLSYRFSRYFELGGYYSVLHADVNDRLGKSARFPKRFQAYQRDLAATLRFDINEYWLWKVEGHFMDGVGGLQQSANPDPTRYWGMFLFRTTVTF